MSENNRTNGEEVPRKSTYETAEGSLPIPAYILKASKQVYTIDMMIQKVIDSEKQYDLSKIVSAYELAEKYHHDQKRESGEPYISHPIAVGYILLELGMDTDTVCAALLHDVVRYKAGRGGDIHQGRAESREYQKDTPCHERGYPSYHNQAG